jgi:uncharacterized protein (TIGR02594 family)
MAATSISEIQQALKFHGFDPGPVDGVWGRRTIAAVRLFQTHEGLVADGIVGPLTSSALLLRGGIAGADVAPVVALLPWFETARQLTGTREIAGTKSNPIILDWADDLDIHYPNDDIAWCGLYVAHCIGSTLPEEVLPVNPLGARRWLNFGVQSNPRLGAVMVFWRGSRTGWQGHVGFYAGEDDGAYQILGGNQSNKAGLAWIKKSRLLEARWPVTALSIVSEIVVKGRNEGLSVNEA